MNRQIQEIWIDLHEELKKFIFSKVKNMETSNDILQDVFLKIQTNIHTIADSTKLTSWVYQITRNTVVDHYRKTHLHLDINEFDFADLEYEEPLYQSLSNCINLKINKLSEKYKQAILLTTFEGFTQLTLADKLGISHSGAKTRVQRAREKLKILISDCKNVKANKKGDIMDFLSE